MEIIGRITKDAETKVLPDGRTVINFSVAVNDSYKTKGTSEIKKRTTYFDCAYWLSPGIAQYLKKGTLVQLSGTLSARAWLNLQGEPKATINVHVNRIQLHGSAKTLASHSGPVAQPTMADDLPF